MLAALVAGAGLWAIPWVDSCLPVNANGETPGSWPSTLEWIDFHEDGFGAKGYSPEVVAEWARPCVPERYVTLMNGGEQFFVAISTAPEVARASLLGFSSYRIEGGKHRTAVYVSSKAARRGVGRALFSAAEAAARANGATELHVDSSVVAVEFYSANGPKAPRLGEARRPLARDGLALAARSVG